MIYDTNYQWSGSERGRGGWARLGGGSRRGRSAKGIGHRERVSKNLRSAARALRKYACDAMPKRRTVHVSVKLQMKGAHTRIELQMTGARDDSL